MEVDFSSKPAVIVPAYNEVNVISKLLTNLLTEKGLAYFNVFVACNACSDGTVSLVRRDFPEVVCLDIQKPSKTNALNKAESLGLGYPRVYIDADVLITAGEVKKLIEYSNVSESPSLVAPRADINTEQSSALVKLFYSAWEKTIFYGLDGFGSGVYVLNRSARQSFELFPDVIADDGYIREVVERGAISVCEDVLSRVEAPRTVADLLSIKTRSKFGNSQLRRMGLTREKGFKSRARFQSRPTFIEFTVYSIVNLISNLNARLKVFNESKYVWQRDESSRIG